MADENATVEPPELRRAYDQLQTDFKKLSADHRNLVATTTFKEAKLDPRHAELFLKVHGDEAITPEAAAKFAEDYGLTPVAEETPTTPPPVAAPTHQQLGSMSGAGTPGSGLSPPGSPVGQKLTQAQFAKMLESDKDGAIRAYAEGRVEHAPGNPLVREAVNKGLISG